MAIGDHFLSHTVVSMLLAWLVACAVAHLVLQRRVISVEVEESSAS
jgi:membrane-associated PAP2 superfamily phosphatase